MLDCIYGKRADMRIDHDAGRKPRELFDQSDDVWGIKVIEQSCNQHDVEPAQVGTADLPHIELLEPDIKSQHGRREPRLLKVRLPRIDAHHRRAMRGQLKRVEALIASEVEHPQLCELTTNVLDNLDDPHQLRRCRLRLWRDREHIVAEPHVVRLPAPVSLHNLSH
jgi:hypothetical protein